MAAAAQGQYAIDKATSNDASGVSLVVLRDEKAKVEAAIAPSKGGELTSLRLYYKGEWVGVTATGTITRSEWGLGFGAPITSDEIELFVSAELKKN